MEAFENLEVWKRGCRLSVRLYRALRNSRELGFKDQITRAALSVPSNIAEGHEKGSKKEFARFLRIAKGSCAELRTQLYIGAEAGLLEGQLAEELLQETSELLRMIQGLIKRCESTAERAPRNSILVTRN